MTCKSNFPEVYIKIYTCNGRCHQVVTFKLNIGFNMDYAKIMLSPNGRYMLAIDKEDTPSGSTLTIAKIMELVMDKTTKVFSLVTHRRIENVYDRYGFFWDDWNNHSTYSFNMYLTDSMELLFYRNYEQFLMYEEYKAEEELKGKFGNNQYNGEPLKTSNFLREMYNGGFMLKDGSKIWILPIDSKNKCFKQLVLIDFVLNNTKLNVREIYSLIDPNLIMFSVSLDYYNSTVIIWDVSKNQELSNFEVTEEFSYIKGANTKLGYIFTTNTYTNLDTGIANHLFDKYLEIRYDVAGGYKFNSSESIYLYKAQLY